MHAAPDNWKKAGHREGQGEYSACTHSHTQTDTHMYTTTDTVVFYLQKLFFSFLQANMDDYFFSKEEQKSKRLRFLLQNVLDQREVNMTEE